MAVQLAVVAGSIEVAISLTTGLLLSCLTLHGIHFAYIGI